jgi:hypothetical protein
VSSHRCGSLPKPAPFPCRTGDSSIPPRYIRIKLRRVQFIGLLQVLLSTALETTSAYVLYRSMSIVSLGEKAAVLRDRAQVVLFSLCGDPDLHQTDKSCASYYSLPIP